MTNPYQAPESQLITNEVKPKSKKIGWKLLFCLLLPLEIWSHYESFTTNEYDDSLTWRLILLAVYSVYMVGLFGLAFNKKILTPSFWFVFLAVLIATDVLDVHEIYNPENFELYEMLIVVAVTSPIFLLLWYSIYRYARELQSSE